MTIYVDNANISADVLNVQTGRVVSSKWCHLISDQLDVDELHEFAIQKLRLRRSYFQERKIGRQRDIASAHYDLTEGKAKQAIAQGATLIDACDLAAITVLKRAASRLDTCDYGLSQHDGSWFVVLEWSYEADDSPMVGAAAYGAASTIWEAVHMALDEIKTGVS